MGAEIPATAASGEGVIYGFVFACRHFDDEATMEMMLAEFAHPLAERGILTADERDVRDGDGGEPFDEGMWGGCVHGIRGWVSW